MKNIIFMLCVILTACGGGNTESPTQKSSEPLKVACIGDSITQGWQMVNGVLTNTPDKSYPSVLAKLTGYTINNYGIGGKTSGQILSEQFDRAIGDKPDMIIVTDGINDALLDVSIEDYAKNNTEMAVKAKNAGIKIYFINNVNWLGINEKLKLYNDAMRKVAKNNNVGFIDIKTIERSGWFCSTDSHPCTVGYLEIAQFISTHL